MAERVIIQSTNRLRRAEQQGGWRHAGTGYQAADRIRGRARRIGITPAKLQLRPAPAARQRHDPADIDRRSSTTPKRMVLGAQVPFIARDRGVGYPLEA